MCQGELPFSIDVKGGASVAGRGVMIARGVLVLPSMPKGDIVDQWLSLMSTQAAPGSTSILHGIFDLPNCSIVVKNILMVFNCRDVSVEIWNTM